jgi:activator of HSP90 ATPase
MPMRKFNAGHRKSEAKPVGPLSNSLTRRQALAGAAIVFASLAADSKVWGETQQPPAKDSADKAANATRTFLHQENNFSATPQRLSDVLLDSKQFAAFTGMTAEIDPKEGGSFSMFDGMIVGRNIELIPGQRIVQAWRPTHWDPGIYSVVKFELRPQGSETLIVLDHTGFPQGEFDHLNPGWKWRYWDPLKKFLKAASK